MNEGKEMSITLLAFGPLAETMGWKRQEISIPQPNDVEGVLHLLGLAEWKERGLVTAINGSQCEMSNPLSHGDELALLPPVSGG